MKPENKQQTRIGLGLVLLLGGLSALPPLSIDMGLPGLPGLARDLRVPVATATQMLSVFLAGFTIGPLVFGPMSDFYGRRSILLGALLVYPVSGLGCAFAVSFPMLLLFRLIQGVAAGAAATIPIAIARDVATGIEARRLQSYVSTINTIGPLSAPLLGAAALRATDWRGIFVLLAAIGVAFLLASIGGYRETVRHRRRPGIGGIIASYRDVASDKRFRAGTFVRAFAFGGMFAYISASPLVFISHFGLSTAMFGALFAFNALGSLSGGVFSSRLAAKGHDAVRIVGPALIVSVLVSTTILALLVSSATQVGPMIVFILVNNFCIGLVVPTAIHTALDDLGHAAGTGAAVMRAAQMSAGALSSALVAFLSQRIGPVALGFGMAGWSSAALVAFLSHRGYFRDPAPLN